MNSLEHRLQLWLALILILLMGTLWVVGNQSIRTLTEGLVVSRLEHDAENLLAALEIDQNSSRIRWRRINQVYNRPLSGHYYLILLPGGRQLRSRSLWDHSLAVPELVSGESLQLQVEGPDGQRLLLWSKGFQKHGVALTLAVAEDLTLIKEQRNQLKHKFGLLALGGLCGLLLIQSLVVRRSFRRLEPLREDMQQLADGKIGELTENVPSEILPLVREFNHLLQLLVKRLERSRNALGNLAHALKGPLNLLIHHFDAVEAGRDGLQPGEAKVQAERIRQLMERELKRARLAGGGMQSRSFDPEIELPILTGLLQQIYQDRALKIEFYLADEVQPFGDREDMLELLGNLLDNACKWAKSEVSCQIGGDGEIQVVVADDGVGISEQELGLLAKRGVRLDETVEGHGLGLAISRDIVKLYGGKIRFSRSSKLGGLQVEINLPRTKAAKEG